MAVKKERSLAGIEFESVCISFPTQSLHGFLSAFSSRWCTSNGPSYGSLPPFRFECIISVLASAAWLGLHLLFMTMAVTALSYAFFERMHDSTLSASAQWLAQSSSIRTSLLNNLLTALDENFLHLKVASSTPLRTGH